MFVKLPCNMLQGMLAIGAALLGAPHVIGVDIDADALELACSNTEEFEDMQAGARAYSCSSCATNLLLGQNIN